MKGNKLFGKNMKNLMYWKDISSVELARILDTPRSNIATWRAGSAVPRYEMLRKIADYFGIKNPTDLVEVEYDIGVLNQFGIDFDVATKDGRVLTGAEAHRYLRDADMVEVPNNGSGLLENMRMLIDAYKDGLLSKEEFQAVKAALMKELK